MLIGCGGLSYETGKAKAVQSVSTERLFAFCLIVHVNVYRMEPLLAHRTPLLLENLEKPLACPSGLSYSRPVRSHPWFSYGFLPFA